MARTGRDGALQKIIDAARDIGLDPGKQDSARQRLAWVLGKQEIQIDAGGVRLCAWLSEKLWLTVSVSVTRGWNRQIEEEVYQSLKRSRRITAMLVMAEWDEIRAICERQSALSHRSLN